MQLDETPGGMIHDDPKFQGWAHLFLAMKSNMEGLIHIFHEEIMDFFNMTF